MEIDDSNRNDDQKRLERSRDKNRKDLERKLQYEPMKTFEAKLSEKAAKEMAHKELESRSQHDLKKSKEEKESAIEKLIGVARDQEADETQAQGRVRDLRRKGPQEEVDERPSKDIDEALDEIDSHDDDPKAESKAEKKKLEQAGEGHKRIEEQQGGQEGGGGFGGQGGGEGGSPDSGSQGSGAGTGGQMGHDKKDSVFSHKLAGQKVAGLAGSKFGSQGRFQQNAQPFTRKDLDDMVASVQLAVNAEGEEEFTVELENEYFGGLKLQAARTDKGVVLRFVCPNASVRSTFIKYRPQVYEHLKAKGISVFRIDIV